MPDYATYRMLVTIVTPLHIGNGQTLLNTYDYAVHKGSTWRINEAALLDAQDVEDPAIAERLAQTPWSQLLQPEDYDPQSINFRYVIKGTPRSTAEGAQVQEQLKNTFDQPYLPGTSLKGALRTALGWYAWEQLGLKPDTQHLGRSPKFAAQRYEQQIFASASPRPGKEPNYDFLKTLQVSDSQPLDPGCLFLINASVINRTGEGGKNIPVELEALRPETTFEATLKVDLALYSDWARRHGLKLPGENWLKILPAICQAHARQRIQHEIAWFSGALKAKRISGAYQQLAQTRPGGNQFLLQLGWGTGWDGMTYGARLKTDPLFMQEIINTFRMARGKQVDPDKFPGSRRSAMTVETSANGQRNSLPAVPLGWVLVTLEPLHDASGWMEFKQTGATSTESNATVVTRPVLASEVRKPAPADTPVSPPPPERRNPQPKPQPSRPILESFSTPPAIGDRFYGVVFYVTSSAVLLSIPGLEDTVAYAEIGINLFSRKPKEDDRVLCEVEGKEQEFNKTWKIVCKKL